MLYSLCWVAAAPGVLVRHQAEHRCDVDYLTYTQNFRSGTRAASADTSGQPLGLSCHQKYQSNTFPQELRLHFLPPLRSIGVRQMRPSISIDDHPNAFVSLFQILFSMLVVLMIDLGERILSIRSRLT
jgi:hypothetical protein